VLQDNSTVTNGKMDVREPTNDPAAPNLSYTESKLHEIAALMANDDDFAVFRKFSELNFFNLLQIQHSLIKLEKDLCDKLRKRLSVTDILLEIRHLLKEYSE
jgi:hypothetical protein